MRKHSERSIFTVLTYKTTTMCRVVLFSSGVYAYTVIETYKP